MPVQQMPPLMWITAVTRVATSSFVSPHIQYSVLSASRSPSSNLEVETFELRSKRKAALPENGPCPSTGRADSAVWDCTVYEISGTSSANCQVPSRTVLD